MKQQIQLRRREVDETADLPAELPPLLRRLYASRGVRSAQELERSVKGMLPWQQLSGVEKAVEILYNAFREGTRIIVVGDFDADGATSTALSVLAMRSLGCSNIDYLVPNRFEDGYGLSPEVVDQAHARGAQLIVTVDNGISSHAGVNTLARWAFRLLLPITICQAKHYPRRKRSLTLTCATVISRRNHWQAWVWRFI